MRNSINIIKYGFCLFLVVAGIVSIFWKNEQFLQAVNSLAIPIFIFSLSLLLVKWNKIVRDQVHIKIMEKDKNQAQQSTICKQFEQKLNVDGLDYKTKYQLQEQLNQLTKEALLTVVESKYLYKFFSIIDVFTIVLNVLATLSFSFCLLVMTGIVVFTQNFMFVNLLSLALVFFDFYILEDIVKSRFNKRMLSIQNKSEKYVEKLEESDN